MTYIGMGQKLTKKGEGKFILPDGSLKVRILIFHYQIIINNFDPNNIFIFTQFFYK